MNKRFPAGLTLALALGLAFPPAVPAAPDFTFTVATHVSDESVLSQSLHKFAEDVKAQSGGRLELNVSTAAALGGQREIIENVNMGAIEMGIGESGLYTNYIPAFGVMALPFMFTSKEAFYAAVDGKAGEHLGKLLAGQTNMHILCWLDGGGFRNVYSVNKLDSIEDLKGVKIRTPESSVFVAMFRAFNANPTAIAAPEMYTALQQKVVTAMEGTNETAVTYGVIDVAKNCLETEHIYNESSVIINKDALAELPEDLRAVLIACARKLAADERELNTTLLDQFKQKMVDAGVNFTPVDKNRAMDMVSGVYKEYIGGDAAKQEVFDLLTGAR
jgi:tripartite ATP-independent transporter DctP family solute receptor